MQKTELIVYKYKEAANLDYQDTYLAPSSYGLKLGLEFSGDPTNLISVGSTITIDKNNKLINQWIDGEATVIGIEPSTLFPPPGVTIFTSRDLQIPIVFSSGEDGSIGYINQNSEYEFYYNLDLNTDNPIPLTYSIADIKDPSKRNTTFSKTITLPGTKQNNFFFKQIYDVKADDSFNANLKVGVLLYTEGELQLNGVLQLKKIIRNDFNFISYEVNVFGEFSNIFYNLGELKLNQLEMGEYDHPYSTSNIINSWDTKIKKNTFDYVNFTTGYTDTFSDTQYVEGGYVGLIVGTNSFNIGDYVYVDKDDDTINQTYNGTAIVIDKLPNVIVINKPWGQNSNNESGTVYVKNPTGEGYVYPYLTYGTNAGLLNRATPFDFLPAVYVKTIVDKIFATAGFTYESNFFNTPYFKRLILPFTSDYLTRDQLTLQIQEFRAGITGGTKLIEFTTDPQLTYLNFNCDTSGATHPDLFDNLQISQGNLGLENFVFNLDTGTPYPSSRYRSNFITKQSFQMDVSFRLRARGINAGLNPTDQIEILPFSFLGSDIPFKITLKIFKKDTSGVFTLVGSQLVNIPYEQTTFNYSGGNISDIINISCQAIDVSLLPNEEVIPYIEVDTPDNLIFRKLSPIGAISGVLGIDIFENSRFYNVITQNNLQLGENVNVSQSLPNDVKCTDFFMGLVKMFNLYVDEDKTTTNRLRIEPRDEYYALGQKLDWTKKLDISKSIEITPLAELTFKDYVYTYKADKDYWNTEYTTYTNDIYGQYSFTTDNEFLKTPSKNEILFSPSPQTEYNTSKISVVEIKTKSNNDSTSTFVRTKSNPRILFYGGVKSYSGWDLEDGNFRLKLGTSLVQYYPYAGMEDDPYIYYNSLCFGFPDFWFYPRPAGFNNTLFNKFYRNGVAEITDSDSKSVSCSVYLTPADIAQLDFRNLIYIDGTYYRLNKITDYNPLLFQTTKVELIKVNDITYFQPKIYVNGGGNDVTDDVDDKLPNNFSQNPIFDNQGISRGTNNNIFTSNSNYAVIGNDNSLFGKTENVLILGGNNNEIDGGVKNVQLIGINNAVVKDSNTVAFGNYVTRNGNTFLQVTKLEGGFYDTQFSAFTGYQQVFSYISPYSPQVNVMDGMDNIAAYVGSNLNISKIDAGLDTTYQV